MTDQLSRNSSRVGNQRLVLAAGWLCAPLIITVQLDEGEMHSLNRQDTLPFIQQHPLDHRPAGHA